MKYLVAVSGGVDSVVLLHMLAVQGKHELIVAHFDHGIRPDSAADARFVEALARKYKLPFVGRREELGESASEEWARSRRYLFLGEEALLREARIVTAHHQDDSIETIAINLVRGTGWRGLAVLDTEYIIRPLLRFTKQHIREYALTRRLEWVEDSTNDSDVYLRNRLRRKLQSTLEEEAKKQLLALWEKQCDLRLKIEEESAQFFDAGPYSRYFFICIDSTVAEELLRNIIVTSMDRSPTRPQVRQALLAIKTARPHTQIELGGMWLKFGVKDFHITVKTP